MTLIPRGQARGLTWFTPGEDPTLISKAQIFARIVSALGGRAAEQVIFGDPEVTTGASGDLQQVHLVRCPLRKISMGCCETLTVLSFCCVCNFLGVLQSQLQTYLRQQFWPRLTHNVPTIYRHSVQCTITIRPSPARDRPVSLAPGSDGSRDNDGVQVTNMARQMVVSYGFSDIGPWTLQDQSAQSGDMIMRMMARNTISESLQQKIDVAVRNLPGYQVHLSCQPRRRTLQDVGRIDGTVSR